jgi:hypothetical protein
MISFAFSEYLFRRIANQLVLARLRRHNCFSVVCFPVLTDNASSSNRLKKIGATYARIDCVSYLLTCCIIYAIAPLCTFSQLLTTVRQLGQQRKRQTKRANRDNWRQGEQIKTSRRAMFMRLLVSVAVWFRKLHSAAC